MPKKEKGTDVVFMQARMPRSFRFKVKKKMAEEGIDTFQILIKKLLERWLKKK